MTTLHDILHDLINEVITKTEAKELTLNNESDIEELSMEYIERIIAKLIK